MFWPPRNVLCCNQTAAKQLVLNDAHENMCGAPDTHCLNHMQWSSAVLQQSLVPDSPSPPAL